MRIRNRILGGAALTAVLVGSGTAAVGASTSLSAARQAGHSRLAASEASGEAAGGKLWLYEHDGFKGGFAGFTGTDRDLTDNYWYGTSRRVDNGASSVKNQTRYGVTLYQNVGCTGAHSYERPNSEDKDLSNNDIRDNRTSCVYFHR
ncbi:peptidase inhibitor family I36 protein [Microbispora sp. NPDC046933]|uniref:peptidase inhibitor family I36 protein n=1 Tax=Microbispora sp. NPDC046933 TaxID=3155618 RepID=UPI003405717E